MPQQPISLRHFFVSPQRLPRPLALEGGHAAAERGRACQFGPIGPNAHEPTQSRPRAKPEAQGERADPPPDPTQCA